MLLLPKRCLGRCAGIATFLIACTAGFVRAADETALDRYVGTPDPAYAFHVVDTIQGLGYRTVVIEMTSQNWRSSAEVDRTLWKHWLRLVVPSSVRHSTAFLLINGGSNIDSRPGAADPLLAATAVLFGAVVAEVQSVPNQPLTFRDEGRPRSEDALIAYSWDKYFRTGDETWPAQLPMTKAAVRAMDTVSSYLRGAGGGGVIIDKFIVAGGSKRGWTAWLTAAVDNRVAAVIPVVIDLLNGQPLFEHHWQTYGFWAPAVRDYEEIGVFSWSGTRQGAALRSFIDPYSYRDRFTMPKFVINASGDEFFPPDSSRFYYDDLPPEKHLRYVPNSGHGVDTGEVLTGVVAFGQMMLGGVPRPRYSWELPAAGGIILRTLDQPREVKLWQATNPSARDFRVERIGKSWISSTVATSGDGLYQASLAAPREGWSAYFLEFSYTVGFFSLTLTTPVRVVPDTLVATPPLGVASAATGTPLIAPGSIASAYGQGLAPRTAQATALPLPVELGGISIRIRDMGGVETLASLFFVSPAQVNFQLTSGVAAGLAQVEVLMNGVVVHKGAAIVEEPAPGLFSANADGQGIAAALATTVNSDGSRSVTPVFDAAPAGSRKGVPFDVSTGAVYLSLFGTGMGARSSVAAATVGGQTVAVAGPVPQSEFAGVDQVNLGPLPRSLAGRGEVGVVLTVGGKKANLVTVIIK